MPPPIAPAPAIQGQQSWNPVDNSGVAFDFTKLASMPASLYEDGEGYRERITEEGWEVERTWKCNWSDVAAAMQWFYGYSFMTQQQAINPLGASPNGLLPGTNTVMGSLRPAQTSGMSRVIPAQDPYRPYLYADHVEVIEGLGVPLQDPGLFLKDILNNYINDQGFELKGGGGGGPVLVGRSTPPPVGVGPPPSGIGEDSYAFSGEVATVFFFGGGDDPTAYNSAIDWGDGSIGEVGTLEWVGAPGLFTLSGAHAYQAAGPFTITSTVTQIATQQSEEVQKIVNLRINQRSIGGGKIALADPLGRQPLPGLVFAECRGPSVIGADGNVSGDFYDGAAKLRVTYRAKNYVIRNDVQNQAWQEGELGRYVERVPNYAIQGVALPAIAAAGGLAIVGTSPPFFIQESGMALMPTASWDYIWHDVPFYPQTAILNIVGKVNSDTFDGIAGFPAFPPGTLLCQAPDIQMRRNASGQMAFRVRFRLDFREIGWNSFPTFFNGKFDFYPATFGGGPPAADGSNLVYKPAVFRNLFALEQAFVFG